MRDFNVIISPIEFISFNTITIDKELGKHSKAVVSGSIADDKVEQYLTMLMGELWVSIVAICESDEQETLMTGVVTDFSIDHEAHYKELTLTIHSGSYLMDVARHFRTFQNADIAYNDVMGILEQEYEDASHIGAELGCVAIEDFLMQYEETDWQFIRRLASKLNYNISPADRFDGQRYYFGPRESEQISFPENTKYTVHKAIGEYLKKDSASETSFSENDCLEYIVSSRDIYRVWDAAIMLGMPVFVYKVESRYEHGEFIHHYHMRTEKGLEVLRTFNGKVSGCSFDATVKAIKEDLVQIEFSNDENTMQEITKWFKYSTVYSTPDGTGWYCMPEVGDTVRLHIPNKNENDGYVISSVHLDVEGSDRKNPDHKSIMNKQRKEILFTPDKLTLTNNNGIRIEIVDGEGVNIVSNRSVNISARDNVTISSERASMIVAGTDAVHIEQSGASIYMDDDISFTGGEFRIQ